MHSTRSILTVASLLGIAFAVPVEKRTEIGTFTVSQENDLKGATHDVQIDNSIHDCGACNSFAGAAFDTWKSILVTSLEPTCKLIIHQKADCSDPGLTAGKVKPFTPDGGIRGWHVECPDTATPACRKQNQPGGEPPVDGPIFDCKPPVYTETLPVFDLGTPVSFPDASLESIIKDAAPAGQIDMREDDEGKNWYNGETLIASFDKATGRTTVIPDLSSLEPGDINMRLNDHALEELLRDGSIIPNDNTQAGIITGSRLGGSSQTFGQAPLAPATYLLQGIVQRTIQYESQAHPVCGSGSQAHFSLDIHGKIRAMSHVWRPATTRTTGQQNSLRPLTADQIQRRITDQLVAAGLTNRATVRNIDLCFYDSGNSLLQPVFRFNATISSEGSDGPATALLVGYIPASGQELEPLPVIIPIRDNNEASPILPIEDTDPTPGCASSNTRNSSTITRRAGASRRLKPRVFYRPPPISVGRYIMSNDKLSPAFVDEANSLFTGLSSSSPRFVDSQYYWDDTETYNSESQSRINSVQLAFSDGHGSPHSFTTNFDADNKGRVSIPKGLATSGFGPGSGGNLSYWILGECSVVAAPKPGKESEAFAPWWKVFNGMHAVVGYNGLAKTSPAHWDALGRKLGKGASVVHSFLDVMLPTGKTSAVTVCGHDGDSVFETGDLGRPECLQMWWYE